MGLVSAAGTLHISTRYSYYSRRRDEMSDTIEMDVLITIFPLCIEQWIYHFFFLSIFLFLFLSFFFFFAQVTIILFFSFLKNHLNWIQVWGHKWSVGGWGDSVLYFMGRWNVQTTDQISIIMIAKVCVWLLGMFLIVSSTVLNFLFTAV